MCASSRRRAAGRLRSRRLAEPPSRTHSSFSSAAVRIAFLVSRDTQTGTYYRYHGLAAALVRLGHEVTVHSQQVLAGAPAAVETRDGVYYRLARRWRGDRWLDPAHHPLSFATRWSEPLPPVDVCHLFQPFENSALLWLRERRRARPGTLMAWDWDDLFHGGLMRHGGPLRERVRSHCFHFFEARLPARAGLVTTCSHYLAELAHQRGAPRTAVIHNGLHPTLPPPPRTEVRARHGLPLDAFLLGFVGWTPTEVDWCLEALGQLDDRVHLVCCGFDVRSIVAQYPALLPRVHHTGVLPPDTARELMTALDAGLLPLAATAFNESRLPIKFADYLGAGLPVFCSEVGECGRLGQQLAGVQLLPANRAAWAAGVAEAVRTALDGPPLRRPDASQLQAQLSWEVLGSRLAEAYQAAGAVPRAATAPTRFLPPASASHPAAGLRVLVLNNYPLDQVWDEVRAGLKPDHHLFGLNHLADLGVEIRVVPFSTPERSPRLQRLAKRLHLPLGHLGRQAAVRHWPEPFDLVYAACGHEANLLALQRRRGRFAHPIVQLLHHPPNPGRLARFRAPLFRRIMGGLDAVVTLSQRLADQLNATFPARSQPARPLPWGPDASYYPATRGAGVGSIAIGRTGRDFTTYGLAATRAGTPAHIVAPPWEVDPSFGSFGPNVRVRILPEDGLLPYPEFLADFAAARVLAIPLDPFPDALAGLTGLLDAIALGRPVLMTRNPYLDLDLEGLGIGRWLDPGDVSGWTEALRWFEDHPAEAEAMGQRALAFHRGGFDSRHFARQLADVFAQVCGRTTPPTLSS